MGKRQKILSIQLPYVDNHVGGNCENLGLAGFYLRHALAETIEHSHFRMTICPSWADTLEDGHLVDYIVKRKQPAVIAATLYLWNVERTLDVLRAIKKRLPSVKILAGGPEVAPDHPFLFRNCIPDAVAVGEGEQVFPDMLKSLRTGRRTDLKPVAWRCGRTYVWGKSDVAKRELGALLPHPSYKFNIPDSNGIAYMETSRGCPLKCAFCCYNHKRHGVSHIKAAEVLIRARILVGRGAKEIRFVDPTFNSNPDFVNILHGLTGLNRHKSITFFAELRAEKITEEHASLLHKANFREIEVGVQSRDPRVLAAISRPTNSLALDRGIRLLARQGIKLTVDVMCGLPFQGLGDVRNSLKWASGIKNAQVQFLHTLLIPGTQLREKRNEYGLCSQARPPYRVTSTRLLSADDIRYSEELALKYTKRQADSPALRFAGRHLPDLFCQKAGISLSQTVPGRLPGESNRRALIIGGTDLYSKRAKICRIIRQALRTEPHTLWQFVVRPEGEEPLDLFDLMVQTIDEFPPHFLDNMTVSPEGYRRVARRVFVLLTKGRRYGNAWVRAVDDLLRKSFF